MAGIDDVAARAGVSAATVSRALSGRGAVSVGARDRVLEAAAALGYVVSSSASGLATGRTGTIGVVVPRLDRWFYTAVLDGAERTLRQHGYDLTLYSLGPGGDARRRVFEHFLLRKRVDAVVAISLELTATEAQRLLDVGKPTVGVGGPIAGLPTVSVDDHAMAVLATRHLIALGHRAIAHIGGVHELELDFHVPTTRRVGYEDALAEAGIDVDPALFRAADFTVAGGHAAALQLLGDPLRRPTAVLAASDEMAIGALLAARDLGLDVPGDVSVVGIDDHDLAAFLGLTTVAQHPREQGRRAVELLLQELEPDRAPAPVIVRPDLVVRASSARATPR